jgi:anti-sigma regulatory factor (Ser/Thr protein kinase)
MQRAGFDEAEAGKVALVVTEVASNLVKHAGGGDLLVRAVEYGGIEVLALDRGPGMANLGHCLRDGFSTAGTPGTGLGAISRLAGLFDIYTAANAGTALLARLLPRPGSRNDPVRALDVGSVHLPHPGEPVCGDGWAVEQRPGREVILVVDGLGHGLLAAEAARLAVRIFRENSQLNPVEILQTIHAALRSTRGAAAAVAELNLDAQLLRFAGVGNISGSVFAAGVSRSAVSQNGTLGHEARRFQEFSYPFPRGALLVMHSDGLATHWRLDQYTGLAARHPGLVAGVLYRDFKRGRDDVTVLAVREAGKDAA